MTLKAVKEYKDNLDRALKLEVAVGVTSDVKFTYESGATVQEVAAKHEFGLGTPMRSFLRTPFIVNKQDLMAETKKQFALVLKGKDADAALGIVGLLAEKISKQSFRDRGDGKWPPLTQDTIDAKGSTSILIDTNVLRGSISSEVRVRR